MYEKPIIMIVSKKVYGRFIHYPADGCTVGPILLELTGTKTFTDEHLSIFRRLGFKVQTQSITENLIGNHASMGGKAKAASINKQKMAAITAELKEQNAKRRAELDKKLGVASIKPQVDIGDLV